MDACLDMFIVHVELKNQFKTLNPSLKKQHLRYYICTIVCIVYTIQYFDTYTIYIVLVNFCK